MKNYDDAHVDFKTHAIQIPRKMQILRFFNLSNFFTIVSKNSVENIYIRKRLYMFRKDINFFSTHKQKKMSIKIV